MHSYDYLLLDAGAIHIQAPAYGTCTMVPWGRYLAKYLS